MDKGLIEINKLKQEIESLQIEEEKNNNKLSDSVKAYRMLMKDIDKLEESNIKLNDEKKKNIEAPQNRKKRKKEIIISLMLVVLTFVAVTLAALTMGLGVVPAFKIFGLSMLLLSVTSSIVLPIGFKRANQMFPIGDVTKLEDETVSNNTKLEKLYSRKTELDNMIALLQEKRVDLRNVIKKLEEEIHSIANIRLEVIEKFYKENPELDKKLDEAYDKSKIKEKVK